MFPYLRFAQFGLSGIALATVASVSAQVNLSKAQAENLWQSAQQAFMQGEPKLCYQQLLNLSDILLGEIAYDRLLGLCAVGAKEYEQALLAFERIVAQQPQNAEIRLERARVYYLTGLLDEAETEFRDLLAKLPPETAKTVIYRYLNSIKNARTPKLRVSTNLEVGIKAGYDSNANSASELEQFLGFSVSDNSRSTMSAMYGADIRFTHARPVSTRSLLTVSTSLGNKSYPDAEFVDQNLGTFNLGWAHYGERHINRIDTFFYAQQVDGRLNSKGSFIRYSHKYKISSHLELGSYYKAGAVRYKNSLKVKDVNQYTLGATANYKVGKHVWGVDLNIGRDYEIFKNSNYRRDIYNIRLSHSYPWNDDVSSRVSAAYYVYDFKRPFFSLSFPDPRDDELLSVNAELRWNITENWRFTPRLGYNDLTSSVDIYGYERWYTELGLNYRMNW